MNETMKQTKIPEDFKPAPFIDYLDGEPSTFDVRNIGGVAITFPEDISLRPSFETASQENEAVTEDSNETPSKTATDHTERAETVKENKILCEISAEDLQFIVDFDVLGGDKDKFAEKGIVEPREGCYYAYKNGEGEIEFVKASEDDLGTVLNYFKNPDLVGELYFEYSTKTDVIEKSNSVDATAQESTEEPKKQDQAETLANDFIGQLNRSIIDIYNSIDQGQDRAFNQPIGNLLSSHNEIIAQLELIQRNTGEFLSRSKDSVTKAANIKNAIDGVINQAKYIHSRLVQSSNDPNNHESLDERSMRNLYIESLRSIQSGLNYIKGIKS